MACLNSSHAVGGLDSHRGWWRAWPQLPGVEQEVVEGGVLPRACGFELWKRQLALSLPPAKETYLRAAA